MERRSSACCRSTRAPRRIRSLRASSSRAGSTSSNDQDAGADGRCRPISRSSPIFADVDGRRRPARRPCSASVPPEEVANAVGRLPDRRAAEVPGQEVDGLASAVERAAPHVLGTRPGPAPGRACPRRRGGAERRRLAVRPSLARRAEPYLYAARPGPDRRGHAGAAGGRPLLRLPRHPASQPVRERLRRPRPFPRRSRDDRIFCRRAASTRSGGPAPRSSCSSSSASVLALLLNRPFAGRGLVQALVFLPWAVPTFLSGLNWAWLFNPVIGPLPHWLVRPRHPAASRTTSSPIPSSPCGGRSSPMSGAACRSSRSRCSPRCSRSRATSTRRRRSTAPAPWQALPSSHPALPRPDHRHHRAAAHRLDRQLRRPDHRHDQRRPGRPHPDRRRATSSRQAFKTLDFGYASAIATGAAAAAPPLRAILHPDASRAAEHGLMERRDRKPRHPATWAAASP